MWKPIKYLTLLALAVAASTIDNNDTLEDSSSDSLIPFEDTTSTDQVIINLEKCSEKVTVHSNDSQDFFALLPDDLVQRIFDLLKSPSFDFYFFQRVLNRRFLAFSNYVIERVAMERNLDEIIDNRYFVRQLLPFAVLQEDNEFAERVIENYAQNVDTMSLLNDPKTLFKLIQKRPYHFKLLLLWVLLSLPFTSIGVFFAIVMRNVNTVPYLPLYFCVYFGVCLLSMIFGMCKSCAAQKLFVRSEQFLQ